jgi:hypothetical protein
MAVREAGIRVTMKQSGFSAGLQSLIKRTKAAGIEMGKGLVGPIKQGWKNTQKTMKDWYSSLGNQMKQVATLGGAISVTKFMNEAMTLQGTYRDIAHNISKGKAAAVSWYQVQSMIEPAANKTGQSTQEMAKAFSTLFEETGDLEYAKSALEAIGFAATASGKSAEGYATAAVLAMEKFGISAGDAGEAIAMFDSKIGVGGANIEDLSSKFGLLAGEAADAGFTGVKGFGQLLDMMALLDDRIAEKSVPGMKALFQAFKDNTTKLKSMEKASGIKLTPDMSAFDKIRAMLSSEKGRVAAELTFTADSRVVYDTLSQPFQEAFKQAKAAGKSTKVATEEGLAAFDQSMKKLGTATSDYASLQREASNRMKDDPSVAMRVAFNKVASAFTDKKMMSAMERLAKLLPPLADGMVKLLSFVVDHPVLAAGGYVGGQVALNFAGPILAKAGGKIGSFAGARLHKAAPTVGAKIGLAAKFALIAAAAYIGYEIGKAAIDRFTEQKNADEAKGFGGEAQATAAARSKNMDVEQKEKILSGIRGEIGRQKSKGSSWGNYFGETYEGAAAAVSVAAGWQTQEDANKRTQSREDNIARLQAAEKALVASIERQKSAKDAESGSVKTASDSARKMAQAFDQAADAAKKLSTASGGKGGPPAPLPNAPGHDAPR